MRVGDRRLLLSHEDQVARAIRVQDSNAHPSHEGVHGYSCIPRALSYVDYNNIWILPVSHTILFGVARTFLKHIFRKNLPDPCPKDAVSYPNRRLITTRAAHYRVPSDYGRRFRDVAQYQ